MVATSCTQTGSTGTHGDSDTAASIVTSPVTRATVIDNIDLTKQRADSFLGSILDTNALYWTFKPEDNNAPRYTNVFSPNGLTLIHAYSDKRYPETVPASDYYHFVLFLIEYSRPALAATAFEDFTRDTERLRVERGELDESDRERISGIHFYSKYGGLVCQKGRYVMSLVETCGGRGPYKSRTWPDYERSFVVSLFDTADSSSIALNADCGAMKYAKETIKTIRSGS